MSTIVFIIVIFHLIGGLGYALYKITHGENRPGV